MNDTNSFVGPNVSEARDFTRHLVELLRKEQGAMVNFLLALSEFDGRRMWGELGYASLFDYLHRELGMSKGSAFYRKTAVGLVQRYPEIVDALAEGKLCMTSLGEVAKVITPENAADILPRFFHRSSREAKEIAAEITPDVAPPVRDVISIVKANPVSPPTVRASPVPVQSLELHRPIESMNSNEATFVKAPPPMAVRAPELEVEPLTADLRRIHITVSKAWLEKLEQVKCALSHSILDGNAEEVIEAAFDALLEREEKRKGLLVKKPRLRPRETARDEAPPEPQPAPEPPQQPRKVVPAHVRREVTRRDEGRCQARHHDGTMCGSTVRVQFDHVIPDAMGGPATIENIRLLCDRHNQLAARNIFGEPVLDLFARRR